MNRWLLMPLILTSSLVLGSEFSSSAEVLNARTMAANTSKFNDKVFSFRPGYGFSCRLDEMLSEARESDRENRYKPDDAWFVGFSVHCER